MNMPMKFGILNVGCRKSAELIQLCTLLGINKKYYKEDIMRNINMIIEYDGSRYLGWQRLGDSDKTIQGKLEKVISEMTGIPTEIIGSGRTDAGAHAKNQVANFRTESQLGLDEIHRYINHYLPNDIVVKEIKEVDERFHSRYNVKSKKYIYYIWNNWISSPFDRKYSFHYPKELNVKLMENAIKRLIGTHDFANFSSLKKSKKSTVRTIEDIAITRNGKMLIFTFIGDGFLHNMVRIIMGTLLEIGSGEKSPSYTDEIFSGNNREIAGVTLPAHGLFLEDVYYETNNSPK